MPKLHFRYGAMGSSKTAQALMTRFNYMEKGRLVWLIKPAIDTRDGKCIIRSRIGLEAEADVVSETDHICEMIKNFAKNNNKYPDVIIADEAQFFTEEQIVQLRNIVSYMDIPVICYGLRTDFKANLFPASIRLFALADEVMEIKSICSCGNTAIINARLDPMGNVITEGSQVELGGNDKYTGMCWHCYHKAIHGG